MPISFSKLYTFNKFLIAIYKFIQIKDDMTDIKNLIFKM